MMRRFLLIGLVLHVFTLTSYRSNAESDSMQRVTAEQVAEFLKGHPLWTLKEGKLSCLFRLKNGFKGAIAFAQDLVEPADHINHHPDLQISYNRVTVTLTTHDVGGLTAADLKLADIIHRIYADRYEISSPAAQGKR